MLLHWTARKNQMHPSYRRLLVSCALLSACAAETNPDESTDSATDSSVVTAVKSDEYVAPELYCETIAEFFCDFYLRCDRMEVATHAECVDVLLESCNGRYEPRYVSLVEFGALKLSAEGIAACRSHLDAVACQEQYLELSGPCSRMWEGQRQAGQGCGYDIESFVCSAGTTCRLSGACGECVSLIENESPCPQEGMSCSPASFCTGAICQPRKMSGEACNDNDRCALGTSCTEGQCRGPEVSSVNQSCDMLHRCPYLSECVEGRCEKTVRLGADCSSNSCETGFCGSDLTCSPLLPTAATCSASTQCISGRCSYGLCDKNVSACL